LRTEPFTPKNQPKKEVDYFWKHQAIQDYDTVFDNSISFRKNDLLLITYFRIPDVPGLHFVPCHRGSWCLVAVAPVTGAAADEYNLNVVDCNASVSVAAARRSSNSSQSVGVSVSGGTPHPLDFGVFISSVSFFGALVLCVRGNVVIHRGHKPIQGDDTGHVGCHCSGFPGSSLSGTLVSYGASGVAGSYFGPRTCGGRITIVIEVGRALNPGFPFSPFNVHFCVQPQAQRC